MSEPTRHEPDEGGRGERMPPAPKGSPEKPEADREERLAWTRDLIRSLTSGTPRERVTLRTW